MDYRIEHDTMGEVRVPANRCWGAQTQRSHENFPIGTEKIPQEIIYAFAVLKKAAALANCKLGNLDARRANAIAAACDEILAGKLDDEFPLVVWQTGSGTQSNMNVNEVVAARANALLGDKLTERQMLTLATAIEGHPDNVAPAMLGGFVTSVIDEGQVYSVKKDIDPELAFAAFVPDFRLLTSKARAALPAMVSHKDAVYNLSRAALATAAFCEGNYALLGVATKDVLHQKYRLPLIEGGDDVFELAQDLGAQAVYISGAGPTIMAVVHKDDTEFFTRAEAALAADSPLHHFTVHRLLADNVGAVVS